MKIIKFSHRYQKLLKSNNEFAQCVVIEEATLLHVQVVELAELHPEFLAYDTDRGTYQLPKKGKYLMLIFRKSHKIYYSPTNLFTTLRRWTPAKEDWYRAAIGETFTVEINEDKEG